MSVLIDERERGIALVVVLWALVILSVIAGSIVNSSRSAVGLARDRGESARAEASADAGFYSAILMLLDPRQAVRWPLDGGAHELLFAGIKVTVSVQDEGGKIDLNVSDVSLLRGLFRSTGLSADAADTMADRFADWRDEDDLRRLNGAESAEYRAAGYRYSPRNRPFQSIDEAKLVLGVTPEIFRRIEPAVTIYSGSAGVDTTVAPDEVLLALPNMSAEGAKQLVERRRSSGQGGQALYNAALGESLLAGHVFMVRAVAVLPGGVRFQRKAVVRITGDLRKPYWVNEWSGNAMAAPAD